MKTAPVHVKFIQKLMAPINYSLINCWVQSLLVGGEDGYVSEMAPPENHFAVVLFQPVISRVVTIYQYFDISQ